MKRWIDQTMVRTAVCAAASLMFGTLLGVWQRALDMIAGRTLYSLSISALTAAAGLALGYCLAAGVFRKANSPVWGLRLALLLLGCWSAFQLVTMGWVTAGWYRLMNDVSRTFMLYLWLVVKSAGAFVGVPSVLAGMAVRQALVMGHGSTAEKIPVVSGQGVTLFLLLGLLPASFGYGVLAGFGVPALGLEGVLRVAVLWFGFLSAAVLMRGVGSVLPIVIVVCLLVWGGFRTKTSILGEGVFGRLVHRDGGFARGTPASLRCTRHHTVAVYNDPDYEVVFTLDGRPLLFGNRFQTARALTGCVPLFLRPDSRKVAVLGPEAGLCLPFFIRAGVADLAYAGSDQGVVEAALAVDGRVTGTDMRGVSNVRQGVRLRAGEGYDLIVLASEPAWMRGTRGAYSRHLFRRCLHALSPDGLVAMHLDARLLTAERFVAIAGDFVRVFPEVQVWQTGASDWLLVGCSQPLSVPLDRMLKVFENTAVVKDLVRGGIRALPEVLSCWVCGREPLEAWLAAQRAGSAWRSAWTAPRALFDEDAANVDAGVLEGCRQKKLAWLRRGDVDASVFAMVRDKAEVCRVARAVVVRGLEERAKGQGDMGLRLVREAAKVSPRDPILIAVGEALELEGRRRIAIGDFKGASKCYENQLSLVPEAAQAYYGLAYSLRAMGEHEAAYLNFVRAVAEAPEQIGYRLELAQVALMIGEYAEADRQYREILKREPKHAEALFRYAKGLALKERPDKDFAQAVKLAERACVLTQWKNPEYAFGLADLYMEAGRVLEGMGLKRRLKEQGYGR